MDRKVVERVSVFFFNDTATTEIYTLSLHDALPISVASDVVPDVTMCSAPLGWATKVRSEEHTSELQSHVNLVCRLLLEKINRAYNRREGLANALRGGYHMMISKVW